MCEEFGYGNFIIYFIIYFAKECAVNGKKYTFAQAKDATYYIGRSLRNIGLKSGDVIALVAPNFPDTVLGFLGSASAGLVVTTINPTYTEGEWSYFCRFERFYSRLKRTFDWWEKGRTEKWANQAYCYNTGRRDENFQMRYKGSWWRPMWKQSSLRPWLHPQWSLSRGPVFHEKLPWLWLTIRLVPFRRVRYLLMLVLRVDQGYSISYKYLSWSRTVRWSVRHFSGSHNARQITATRKFRQNLRRYNRLTVFKRHDWITKGRYANASQSGV